MTRYSISKSDVWMQRVAAATLFSLAATLISLGFVFYAH